MPSPGRLPLTLLWALVGVLLLLPIGGQIAVINLQAALQNVDGSFGNGQSDRQLVSNIISIAPAVLPHVLRAGLLGGVALLFVHAVRWQRARAATPSSLRAPSRGATARPRARRPT